MSEIDTEKNTFEKLDMQSPDLVSENIAKIQALFPNCVTEAADGPKIDFDLLKQELSSDIVDGRKERYRLEWPGKRESLLMANTPTNKTLRPIREDSVDFDNTENIYIEGDNLEVLKLLQGSYHGKVKMIYIDPPYNTGKDFVYSDKFAQDKSEYEEESGQVDEEGNRLFLNTESNGRYHSDWLSMMYPRLKLARNLLSKEGVIFISIDDHEVDNLKKLCSELFGAENFQGQFCVKSTPNARDYGHIGKMHEYVLMYSKNHLLCKTNQLIEENKKFKYSDAKGGFNIHPLYNSNEAFNNLNRPNLYYPFYINPLKRDNNGFYSLSLTKDEECIEVYPPKSVKNSVQFVWRWGVPKSNENINIEIVGHKTTNGEFRVVQKMRHTSKIIRSILLDKSYSSRQGTSELESLFGQKLFSFPKPLELIKKFIQIGTNDNDIVLDFFAGSATTAHAIMDINVPDEDKRKYIVVQIPEQLERSNSGNFTTLSQLAIARVKLAATKIKDETGADIDYGFRVYRLDDSNMNDVYYLPQDYEQGNVQGLANNIKMDRTSEDLLTQIILDWGLPLSLPIEQVEIGGKKVYKVAGDSLFACFDADINESFAEAVAEYKPHRLVFKDNSFSSNNAKINMKQVLMQLCPETEVKVI